MTGWQESYLKWAFLEVNKIVADLLRFYFFIRNKMLTIRL